MPLDNMFQGEVYTVRTYKVLGGFAWANSYEVQATTDIPNPTTAVDALVSSIVALERALHLDIVTIDRVVVSTYVPDGLPYNPVSFTTIPVNLPGLAVPAAEPLPLEICLFVRRDVPVGRDGRLLYRGCLSEAAMTTIGLRPVLPPVVRNSIQAQIGNWLAQTGLPQGFQFVLARGRPAPTNVRIVTGLVVSEKLAIKKVNNRYFDRP